MNTEIYFFISLVWLTLIIRYCFNKVINSKESKHKLKQIINFSSYYAILEFHLSKAYEMIYKDRILIYSLEATKLTDVEFLKTSKDFGSLVVKMIGPSLYSEFVNLYGTEETFLFIISEYFNSKYEEDAIRKGSMDQLMEKEIDG